jgi:hypothetical protein
MENEIESNLDHISHATGRLNLLARAQGEEIQQQNRLLEGLGKKVRMAALTSRNHSADTSSAERPSRRSTRHESETTRPYPLTWRRILFWSCKYQRNEPLVLDWMKFNLRRCRPMPASPVSEGSCVILKQAPTFPNDLQYDRRSFLLTLPVSEAEIVVA